MEKDITKFPHAEGKYTSDGPGAASARHSILHHGALEVAVETFIQKYGRVPNWHKITFRGFHTKGTCLIIIWEE